MDYELDIAIHSHWGMRRAYLRLNDHINGGNPEHVCPETGLEAWCFHKACELNTCEESKAQRRRIEESEATECLISRKQKA